MNTQEKNSRMLESFEKALKKALPDGIELLDDGEIFSGKEDENDGYYELRYLIGVRKRFQVYREWHEKQLKSK